MCIMSNVRFNLYFKQKTIKLDLFSHYLFNFSRRVNISHWRDKEKCWKKLVNQKTYIILMQSNIEKKGEKENGIQNTEKRALKSKSENDLGDAFDFNQELEKHILRILGE